MGMGNEELEYKFIEMFKVALMDMSTTVSFHVKYEMADDVVVLNYRNNIIILYKLSQVIPHNVFSKKWRKRFKGIKNDIAYYNNTLNKLVLEEKPIYVDYLSDSYDSIISKINSKYTKFNRWLYGEPWEVENVTKTFHYMKINQISVYLKIEDYKKLFAYSLEIEKQKTILRIDSVLREYKPESNTLAIQRTKDDNLLDFQEFNIDDILDKISKGGFECLTDSERDFLTRGNKKDGK